MQHFKIVKMKLNIYIQLIFLCIVNVIFTLAGTILNSLVILSFWKSSVLKRKMCYFTIMILSCFDLLAAITNHPVQVVYSFVWLTESYVLLTRMNAYLRLANMFIAFSLLTILVMSIERYIATAHPLFHRTSVNQTRLLILLSSYIFCDVTMYAISFNDWVITFPTYHIIFYSIFSPLLIFVNYKLFKNVVRARKSNAMAPKTNAKVNNIHSCLLVVSCYLIFSTPGFVYSSLGFMEQPTSTNAEMSWVWGSTVAAMNSTFNCLIFFWRNKVLRQEAKKILNFMQYHRQD